MDPRRTARLAALAMLVVACGAGPSSTAGTAGSSIATAPGTSASARATTAPVPASTPAPSPPAGPLPRTTAVEQDGVRVMITLERNPMPAGEPTWMTSMVRNTGRDDLTWLHDGCAISVSTWGEMQDVTWRPGVAQSGVGAAFKARVLGGAYDSVSIRGPIIDFVPEELVGRGEISCADLGIPERIRPGESFRQRYAWTGMAHDRWGPPPSGPVTLTATFASWWRGPDEPEGSLDDRAIRLSLDAWIVDGVDATWLSPPEVVDAALADPGFAAYLAARLGSGTEGILWFCPDLGVFEVGLLDWDDATAPGLHLVLVDPRSGAIVETVDRPWDRDTDGYP